MLLRAILGDSVQARDLTMPRTLLSVSALRRMDTTILVLSAALGGLCAALAAGGPWAKSLPLGVGITWVVAAVLAYRWGGSAWLRWLLAGFVTALSATPLVLSGGKPEYLLPMLLTLSVLPVYRAWPLLAVMGGVMVVHLLSLSWWGVGSGLSREALTLAVVTVLAQASYLVYVARVGGQRDSERFDVEFLVKAMGFDGPIRLNFDAVRAESVLGKRLKHVQDRMADALRQVDASTQGVHGVASVLKNSGAELMQRTESSANGLRDAAMVLEQITVIVKSSAEAALEARSHADAASDLATGAGQIIQQMVGQMRHIDQSARRITDIIAVIDGIAFQTNILALNAAVEAARAGEQGRGFAVVAAEVRSLAMRASEAAKEIKGLVAESLQTVEQGNQLADSAGGNMQHLVEAVKRAGNVFRSLSADTDEHANSIEAVTQAVKDLDELTRQNVAVAERADEASRTLAQHAGSLSQVLAAFRISHTMPPPVTVSAMSPPKPSPPPQARRLATSPVPERPPRWLPGSAARCQQWLGRRAVPPSPPKAGGAGCERRVRQGGHPGPCRSGWRSLWRAETV
ncbi:MAG: hypothetical protein C4K60_01295 [Ideonella sp. MAG2]|nr:MAG: hypothetical protein C4K60_01295 [Ideonella sp. MAG2]